MKKILYLIFVAAGVAACTCNTSTRPESKLESETKVIEYNAVEQRMIDSLKNDAKVGIIESSRLGGPFTTEMQSKYAIVVGAFRHRHYAERRMEDMKIKEYSPAIVGFKNGLYAVVIEPSDDLERTLSRMKQLRTTGDVPNDCWILTLQ